MLWWLLTLWLLYAWTALNTNISVWLYQLGCIEMQVLENIIKVQTINPFVCVVIRKPWGSFRGWVIPSSTGSIIPAVPSQRINHASRWLACHLDTVLKVKRQNKRATDKIGSSLWLGRYLMSKNACSWCGPEFESLAPTRACAHNLNAMEPQGLANQPD